MQLVTLLLRSMSPTCGSQLHLLHLHCPRGSCSALRAGQLARGPQSCQDDGCSNHQSAKQAHCDAPAEQACCMARRRHGWLLLPLWCVGIWDVDRCDSPGGGLSDCDQLIFGGSAVLPGCGRCGGRGIAARLGKGCRLLSTEGPAPLQVPNYGPHFTRKLATTQSACAIGEYSQG